MDEILSTFEKTWNTVFESKGNGFNVIYLQIYQNREKIIPISSFKLRTNGEEREMKI